MSRSDEERFLDRIRRALGRPAEGPAAPAAIAPAAPEAAERELLARIASRTDAEREKLFATLCAAAAPLKLEVTALPDRATATAAIARLAAERSPEWGGGKSVAAWRHPLIDALGLPEALGRAGIPVFTTEPIPEEAPDAAARRRREREAVAAAFIGVTGADFCLADTATLVLVNRPGAPRSVATLPSIHVAVVTRPQLLADMRELFALWRWDERFRAAARANYLAFISGPSKTADIEATMVHGAHGPRELHLLVLAE